MQTNIRKILTPLYLTGFAALAWYFLYVRNADTLFFMQDRGWWNSTKLFWDDCTAVPGGVLAWAGAYLTQYFYHPAVGCLMLIALWALTFAVAKRSFRVPAEWSFLLLIPMAALLCSDIQLGYWVYILTDVDYVFHHPLGLLAALLLSLPFWRLLPVGEKVQGWMALAWIPLVAALFYYPLGIYALLAAAIVAMQTIPNSKTPSNSLLKGEKPGKEVSPLRGDLEGSFSPFKGESERVLVCRAFSPAWRMFGFSSKLMLANIVNICNLHAFSVLLGRFFGDHAAGVYSTARRWDDMASGTINSMVTGVAQPTLTQVREDAGRYRAVFRKMLRFVCFVSFPAMLGLGMVAQEFILLAGGEKWRESGFILSLLCIHGATVPITTLYSNLTISRGRSDVNMAMTITQCTCVWAGLILLYPYGMLPMVVYFVMLGVAWLVIWQWWARRLTGLTFLDALRDTVPFLALTLAVLALTWWLTRGIGSLWLLLVSRILLAAVLYCGLVWLSGAKIMREAIHYMIHNS